MSEGAAAVPPGKLERWLVPVGGIALLLAMGVDALAVAGRHLGLPLLGSIELVQACVTVSGATALVLATLARAHARVHLLVDRLPPRWQGLLDWLGDGLSVLFFLSLAVASGWIALELWGGHEQSELLGIGYRPLRLTVTFAVLACTLAFAVQWLRRRAS